MKTHFGKWASSLALTSILVLALCVLMGFSLRTHQSHQPPDLPGYSWSTQPNSVLIVVPPDDCGCGVTPEQLTREAVRRGLHVVIAYSAKNPSIRQAKRISWPTNTVSFVDVQPSFIARFASHKKIAILQVKDGAIIFQAEGTVSTDTIRLLKV